METILLTAERDQLKKHLDQLPQFVDSGDQSHAVDCCKKCVALQRTVVQNVKNMQGPNSDVDDMVSESCAKMEETLIEIVKLTKHILSDSQSPQTKQQFQLQFLINEYAIQLMIIEEAVRPSSTNPTSLQDLEYLLGKLDAATSGMTPTQANSPQEQQQNDLEESMRRIKEREAKMQKEIDEQIEKAKAERDRARQQQIESQKEKQLQQQRFTPQPKQPQPKQQQLQHQPQSQQHLDPKHQELKKKQDELLEVVGQKHELTDEQKEHVKTVSDRLFQASEDIRLQKQKENDDLRKRDQRRRELKEQRDAKYGKPPALPTL